MGHIFYDVSLDLKAKDDEKFLSTDKIPASLQDVFADYCEKHQKQLDDLRDEKIRHIANFEIVMPLGGGKNYIEHNPTSSKNLAYKNGLLVRTKFDKPNEFEYFRKNFRRTSRSYRFVETTLNEVAEDFEKQYENFEKSKKPIELSYILNFL